MLVGIVSLSIRYAKTQAEVFPPFQVLDFPSTFPPSLFSSSTGRARDFQVRPLSPFLSEFPKLVT